MSARVALALLLLLTACGESDEEQALGLAREACGNQPSAPGSVAGITRVEEIATVVEDSATNAARAARLDPAWNALSRATSDLSDVYAYAATLPLDGGGRVDLGRAPKAKVDELRALLEDEAEWSATIRAECRKATA